MSQNPMILQRDFLNNPDNLERIADVAAANVKPATIVRFALRAMQKVPKLAECSRTSILLALMDAAACGLEPDGRKGHLVPYGSDAVFVPGYQGLIDRMREGGAIKDIWTEVVYADDEFSWERGDQPRLRHVPNTDSESWGDLSSARGVYCCVRLSDGSVHSEYMPRKAVLAIKARVRANKSPWNDPSPLIQAEMWRKTVVRRSAKYIPYLPDLAELLLQIDETEHASHSRRVDVEVTGATTTGSRIAALPAPGEPVTLPRTTLDPDPDAAGPAGSQADESSDGQQQADSGASDPPDRSTLDGLIGMTRYCQATKRIHQLMIENGLEAETVAGLLDEFAAASEKTGKWVQIKDIPAGGIRERFADAVRDHIDRMAAATAGGDDGHAGNGAS